MIDDVAEEMSSPSQEEIEQVATGSQVGSACSSFSCLLVPPSRPIGTHRDFSGELIQQLLF